MYPRKGSVFEDKARIIMLDYLISWKLNFINSAILEPSYFLIQMITSSSELYQSNLQWLMSVSPDIANKLSSDNVACLSFKPSRFNSHDEDLYVNGERWIEGINETLDVSLNTQLSHTDGISLERVVIDSIPDLKSFDSYQILSEMVNNIHLYLSITCQVLNLTRPINLTKPYKNAAIFGSLSLPFISFALKPPSLWSSVTLIEDDLTQFAAALHLFDFQSFFAVCKANNIGLALHFDSKLI